MTKKIENDEIVEKNIEEQENGKVVLKGREESIIKYAFIILGLILVLSIVAFAVITLIPEKIIAVGDRKITKDEFVYYYKYQADLILKYKKQIAPNVDDYDFLMSEYKNGVTYSQAAAQRALGVILETYVVNDLANGGDETYVYDKKELEDAIDTFKTDFEKYAKDQDQKFDDVSKGMYGCTYKTLLKAYEMSWVATKYQKDTIAKLQKDITEEQKTEYYNNFKDTLDTVTVRHILIASFNTTTGESYTEDEKKAALAKAKEAYQKILDGEDFLTVAKQYSEDPSVEENEGVYSFKKADTQLSEFADWAFAAKVGDIGFVETAVGYHIIELLGRTGYEDAKDTVSYNIAYGQLTKKLEAIEATDEYKIGYFDGYYQF